MRFNEKSGSDESGSAEHKTTGFCEGKMKFKQITACLDMYGCPNRCRHCWIGHSPNGKLSVEDLKFVAEQFRPFADQLTVYDWYREPDYKDNYRELWRLCNDLSDGEREHYELISVWRIVRDSEYVKWLSTVGVNVAQLTLFGGPEKTDFYTGRKNAYRDILEAIESLLNHKIVPRIQFFVNKDTIDELPFVENLIDELRLEERCREFGGEFVFFLHQGSCDGENEKLYDLRVTTDDLQRIPMKLAEYTVKHFKVNELQDVFGTAEQVLYEELIGDCSTKRYVSESPVFFIDQSLNVYPNISSPDRIWFLGNLKTDGARAVLDNYAECRSVAQHARMTVPLCEMVKTQGDRESRRLFGKGDYVEFVLNKYCRG